MTALHSSLLHCKSMSNVTVLCNVMISNVLYVLLDILLDGGGITTELVAHYLLAGNGMYHRVDPRLPRWVALDEVPAVEQLQQVAEEFDLTATNQFIRNCFVYDDV